MDLSRLALTDFRSYADAELAPDPGLTVIAAPERRRQDEPARGRSTSRSPADRTGPSSDAELVRHGAPLARIGLELAGGTAAGGATIELVLPGAEPPPGLRQAADRQRRAAAAAPRWRRLPRRPLPARGDAAARRVPVGAAPLPGRHPGPARSARGARPGGRSAASWPSATPCCAPFGPRRRRPTRSPFWDEQLAHDRRAGDARPARGARRARRAHRSAPRRGRRIRRAGCLGSG